MSDERNRRIIGQMIRTNRIHKKAIDRAVHDDIGLHRGRHQVLMKLSMQDKFKSQKEIAEHLGITQAAMTGALASLERDGYIKRQAGKDSRFNEISITEKGRQIIDLTREHFSAVDSAAFEGLSDDELEVFYNCLLKVDMNLESFLKEGDKEL